MGEATLKPKTLDPHINYEGCQAVGLEGHHSAGVSEMLNNFWAARGRLAALNTTPSLPYQARERQGHPTAALESRQTSLQQPLAFPALLPTVLGSLAGIPHPAVTQ